jgi:hypothetical protein
MHPVASFQVKNNGKFTVTVTASPILPAPVEVPPGETSAPFYASAKYTIVPKVDVLPEPPAEVIVDFNKKGNLDARAVHSPTTLNVDVIAKFDFA